jgi:hypothetical protein
MLLDRYNYEVSKSFLRYNFYSEGPRGRIKKAVLYGLLGARKGVDHYNLAFGDYDHNMEIIDDLSISNNGDRDKILATVAFTVIEFAGHFPGCKIVAGGSTPARTRLYQMGIAKYYKEISVLFDIQGLTENDDWVSFKTRENYKAILVSQN